MRVIVDASNRVEESVEARSRKLVALAWRALPWAALLMFAASLAWVVAHRTYLNDRTESDYVGGFVPEAQRILDGLPPLVRFHPPFYALVLAGVQAVVRDWFASGLLLSWASAVVAVVASFVAFDRVAGRASAWGAALAIGCSYIFLKFASWATSDVFFLAGYCVVWAIAAVLVTRERRRVPLAALLGGAAAFVVLARTNGIVLAPVLAAPLLLALPWKRRVALTLIAGGVFGGVGLTWVAAAKLMGSPVSPPGTAANIAMTYFAEGTDRISGDGLAPMEERFHTIWDVLTHDPQRLATVYTRDLVDTYTRKVLELTVLPILLAALPGLVVLARRTPRAFFVPLAAATVFHALLVNLKTPEARHLLFLLPLLGAAAGALVQAIGEGAGRLRVPMPVVRVAGLGLIALLTAVTVNKTLSLTGRDGFLSPDYRAEVEELLPVVRRELPKDAVLFGRKATVPFHAGLASDNVPHGATMETMREELAEEAAQRPTYLLYGFYEADRRKELASLADPSQCPPWLRVVAQGEKQRWVLYRFEGDATAPAPHGERRRSP